MNIRALIQTGDNSLCELIGKIDGGQSASVFGLKVNDALTLSAAFEKYIYIAADIISAYHAVKQLESLGKTVSLILPPDNILLPIAPLAESTALRCAALYKALRYADVTVTIPEALAQYYPDRQRFLDCAFELKTGQKANLDELINKLASGGYKRQPITDCAGQFACRGDILDIFRVDGVSVRIQFFGSTVESINILDTSAQTMGAALDSFCVYPATDVFYSHEEAKSAAESIAKEAAEKEILNKAAAQLVPKLEAGEQSGALYCAVKYFKHQSFFEFFNSFPLAVAEDAKRVFDNYKNYLTEHNSRFRKLSGEVIAASLEAVNVNALSNAPIRLAFHAFDSQNRIFNPQNVYNFKSFAHRSYVRDMPALLEDIAIWRKRGFKVLVCAGAAVRSFFADNNTAFGTDICAQVAVLDSFVESGAVFFDANLIIIGRSEITYKKSAVPSKRRNGAATSDPPAVGDYVVHEVHGIGICESIGAVTIGGITRDYITVAYKNQDKLYLPVENIGSLSRYTFTQTPPALSRLGGEEFKRVKERVKSSLKKMVIDLAELYAHREAGRGHAYKSDDELYEQFCYAFPYEETGDQLTAADEAITDLKRGKIMDRLLCGDVGFGKTEVALRVAFKVIEEGKQVAFMSPTTVLSRQHFNTVAKRMEPFGVRVASLSRFDENIKETLSKLKCGGVDIIVGTHRLLSADVKFKDLGLLILDEEQKFGVEHKEKIKTLKSDINVLTLSATPIPRTLHMALTGIRDISRLDTPPEGRLPAQVYVTEYSDALVCDAVTREIARQGQVFVVYNYVQPSADNAQSIAAYTQKLSQMLPDVKIGYAHGQMDKKTLTSAVDAFTQGELDVLVATTIIENGIDIPRANTLIVYGAERLGLAQMYQLKGRVGRADRVAHVYFTYLESTVLSETAQKRLEAIAQFTELNSGIKIAEADLEIRGVGNVFGRAQHGHLEKVGYSLYCKLLRQAVAEQRGEKVSGQREPQMSVARDAFIPKDYCDPKMRLKIYTRISELNSLAARSELKRDIERALGEVPVSVLNLMSVGLIKNLAKNINAVSVDILKKGARIEFESIKDIPLYFTQFKGVLNAGVKPIIVFDTAANLLKFLLNGQNEDVSSAII